MNSSPEKQTEGLHNASQLNKQIIESVHEGIIVYDRNLCYLVWNPFMERITGLSAEDILGRHPSEVFPFLMEVGMLGRLERALGGEHPGTMDFPYSVPETGCSGWVLDTSSPLLDTAGKIIGVIATVSDITERKEAETALRKSEEKYRLLFASAGDAILIHDEEGRMLEVNPQAVVQLGYSREELLVLPLDKVDAPEENRHIPERMAVLMAQGWHQFETVHRRKDGSRVPTEVKLRQIIWDDRPAILSICRDISRRWQAEAKLLQAKAELEGRVAERTAELSAANAKLQSQIEVRRRIEEELLLATKAAKAANQAKSDFLANMSHEIRTPMNGIIGMAQLLEFTELSVEQKGYLEAIEISSENLLALINDVLDLSKIEAGKVELEKKEFSLRRSVGDIIKTQASLIHGKGLALTTHVPAEVPDTLIGDQFRLKQILLNLLGNAVKFTAKGKITVAVTLQKQQKGSALLKFSVTDTGIGIKPEAIDKIFSPFSQADTSTTRTFGGTGLGLSICTKLAGLMGGSIDVESSEGSGSTFAAVIPFVALEPLPPRQERQESVLSLAWKGDPLRILLAEDDKINWILFEALLIKFGHRLDIAENGHAAVAKWEANDYDLILMDIQMPGMDGIQATGLIRERERGTGGHIPIIALTAHAMREDRQRLLEQGFDGYVAKPADIKVLLEEMSRCLPKVRP